MALDQLALTHLLPIQAVEVVLRFNEKTQIPFFPQWVLGSFLRELAGSPADWSSSICVVTEEIGIVDFHAGEAFRFALFALPKGRPIIDTLREALVKLPHSAPRKSHAHCFRDNLELVSINPVEFSNREESGTQQGLLTQEALDSEALYWAQLQQFSIEIISPICLKPPDKKVVTVASQIDFTRFHNHLQNTLLNLLRELQTQDNPVQRSEPPASAPIGCAGFWIDLSYLKKGRIIPVGGCVGNLLVNLEQPLSLADARLLVMGQYLGVGQNRSFGFGRFKLAGVDGLKTCVAAPRAQTALARAASQSNLQDSLKRAEDALQVEGTNKLEFIGEMSRVLCAGGYEPPPVELVWNHSRLNQYSVAFQPVLPDLVARFAVASLVEKAVFKLCSGQQSLRPRRDEKAWDDRKLSSAKCSRLISREEIRHSISSSCLLSLVEILWRDPALNSQVSSWLNAEFNLGKCAFKPGAKVFEVSALETWLCTLAEGILMIIVNEVGVDVLFLENDLLLLANDRETLEQSLREVGNFCAGLEILA